MDSCERPRSVLKPLPPSHRSTILQSFKVYIYSTDIKTGQNTEVPTHPQAPTPSVTLLKYPASGLREQQIQNKINPI